MARETNYFQEAQEDALQFIEEYKDEIIQRLLDDGEASDDVNNDYSSGDSYFHESFVDRDYSLLEAATLLDQLDQYEETDSGLWENQTPREALSAQAAYTYGNAVGHYIQQFIKEINERFEGLALPDGNDCEDDEALEKLEAENRDKTTAMLTQYIEWRTKRNRS